MFILYWNCELSDYEESWDGEEETRYYMCKHPKGDGYCGISNKYVAADCKLLDEEKT